MKSRISYVCQECGYDSAGYLGKCPECAAWNSFKEIRISETKNRLLGSSSFISQSDVRPKSLDEISSEKKQRLSTQFTEFNTVLGGGLVFGSVVLLAGDPGVGKSTLLLQLAMNITKDAGPVSGKNTVLYISGEESVEQIKMRAMRIMSEAKNLFLLSVTDPDYALEQIEKLKPSLVIVDSIQTMQSQNVSGLSGSVAQVRYATLNFIRIAKALNIPAVLVGHVTKEGMVAGPMVLSHMVDVVLFLEGEKFIKTRILRSLKNRFGPVDEVGIFVMEEEGMKEIKNAEQLFLVNSAGKTPGSVIVAPLEGSRTFLVELQSLVVSSKLPMPRRVVSGIDQRRVELLLAVLQKHCLLPVDTMDVFVNVAGGMKISDPAIDLGICLAVYSSLKNKPLSNTVGISEVGLLGELRTVPSLDKRLREAKKLGFNKVISALTHKTLREVIGSF